MACFIIAEAGVNHNGSIDLALQLIQAGAQAGADAVKFQTFVAERVVCPGAEKAAYQVKQTGSGDQFSLLRHLELPAAAYTKLAAHSAELGIEFMSTPFDEECADLLTTLDVKRIKIASGEITNLPFLKYLAVRHIPLILSTGMANLEEVGEAIAVIKAAWRETGLTMPAREMLTVLHCTSNYPAALTDANLCAMHTLAAAFDVPVGYSDHTKGTVVPIAAVAMGAVMIEKHLTLDQALPGPDHTASLEPGEFREMVDSIRAVEASLGSGEKVPRPSELPVRELVRRSVTVKRSLKAGEVIAADDVTLLRPGDGIAPKDLPRVIGMRARSDLPAGRTLLWSDIMK